MFYLYVHIPFLQQKQLQITVDRFNRSSFADGGGINGRGGGRRLRLIFEQMRLRMIKMDAIIRKNECTGGK